MKRPARHLRLNGNGLMSRQYGVGAMISLRKRGIAGVLVLSFALMWLFLGLSAMAMAANININLVLVNPSETESKTTPIKYLLPKELNIEDIVSVSGLAVDYDVDEGAYYVYGEVTLAAKESKTIKIEVKDRWNISQEEIDVLKDQIDRNIKFLEGKEHYDSALLLREMLNQKLDRIMQQQRSYSENIERRIEEYRANLENFDEIREQAFSVDYFKSGDPPKLEEKEVSSDKIKFVIEVRNPSAEKSRKVKQQHFLPSEVTMGDVVESKGFDVRYDPNKKQSYLVNEEEFAPSEVKKYDIIIRDIWRIGPEKTASIRELANKIMEEIANYDDPGNAQYLVDKIDQKLDQIDTSRGDKQDVKKYIGNARANKVRFKEAETDLEKLKKLLAVAKAKKLEELEKSKVKNILMKLQTFRGLADVASVIFGKKPSMTMIWRVIWFTMGFVAIFTLFNFFTWWRRSKFLGDGTGANKLTEIKNDEPDAQPEKEKET